MSQVVILLGHKAGVGKDTLGQHLIEKEGFKRLAFADKLKDVVADLYGFTNEQMYTDAGKNTVDERYGLTPRVVLQDFGQEQRARFPDIWADYVFRQIELLSSTNFVITDFRFPNEFTVAERYASKGNMTVVPIKITRPGRGSDFAGAQNISETALDDFQNWSFFINNDGSIDELYAKYKSLDINNFGGKLGSTGDVRAEVSV